MLRQHIPETERYAKPKVYHATPSQCQKPKGMRNRRIYHATASRCQKPKDTYGVEGLTKIPCLQPKWYTKNAIYRRHNTQFQKCTSNRLLPRLTQVIKFKFLEDNQAQAKTPKQIKVSRSDLNNH